MMKKLGLGCLVLLGIIIFVAPAVADDLKFRKKTVIDFEDALLEGELKKPAGSYITERREMKFKNLIKARTNFDQEMYKSVYVLK